MIATNSMTFMQSVYLRSLTGKSSRVAGYILKHMAKARPTHAISRPTGNSES